MTVPTSFPSSGGSVQLGGGGSLERYLPIILASLQHAADRRQRQAEFAVGSIAPGTAYGALSHDLQQSVHRATGRKWSPDEIVTPFQNTDQAFAQMLDTFAPRGSAFRTMMAATSAVHSATGQAQDLSTPESFEQAGTARSRARVALARLDERQSNLALTAAEKVGRGEELSAEEVLAYNSARGTTPGQVAGQEQTGRTISAVEQAGRGAMAASQAGQELTPAQLTAFQARFNFVPSEARSRDMSAAMRQSVMQYGMNMLRNPNSAAWNNILGAIGGTGPDGRPLLSLGDIIAAAAVGIDTTMNEGARIRNTMIANEGQANNLVLEAQLKAATEVANQVPGLATPDFILAVMQGDSRAVNSDRGRLIQNVVQAGYMSAMAKRAAEGDPSAQLATRMLELLRSPGVANNPELFRSTYNAQREAIINSNVRALLGYDRPIEPGAQQQAWDAAQRAFARNMLGVMTTEGRGWGSILGPFGMMNTNIAPSGAPAPGTGNPDQEQIRQFQAMLGNYGMLGGTSITPTPQSGIPGVQPAQPTPTPGMPNQQVPGLFGESLLNQQRRRP